MIKVNELKDDAIVKIPVSKGYYMMVKALAYNLVDKMIKSEKSEEYLKDVGNKPYAELDEDQRSLHTVTLLVAEIEAQSKLQELVDIKEVLEPGDEGYVAPTVD